VKRLKDCHGEALKQLVKLLAAWVNTVIRKTRDCVASDVNEVVFNFTVII
jgi:hypothetical protein